MAHRQRGLGTVVAAAALEHGLAHGLNAIHWTCAALGQQENALKYLGIAAKLGWSAAEMTEQATEFCLLHETPEWAALMAQIRRNQKG